MSWSNQEAQKFNLSKNLCKNFGMSESKNSLNCKIMICSIWTLVRCENWLMRRKSGIMRRASQFHRMWRKIPLQIQCVKSDKTSEGKNYKMIIQVSWSLDQKWPWSSVKNHGAYNHFRLISVISVISEEEKKPTLMLQWLGVSPPPRQKQEPRGPGLNFNCW